MMELLISLGRTLGFSLTSGVNLYATVAILGLAARYDWVSLPPQYEVFGSDWVIGGALVLYAIEFVADKIPWVDSIWDSVHTFIRPMGGALVAVATLGEASPSIESPRRTLGGTIAAGSHLTKASTRVAANTSPEPFTQLGAQPLRGRVRRRARRPGAEVPARRTRPSRSRFSSRLCSRSAGSFVNCGDSRGRCRHDASRFAARGRVVGDPSRWRARRGVSARLLALLPASGAVDQLRSRRRRGATPAGGDQPPQPEPRFRAGANLVRVDAYVMADGKAVTDLTLKDFEVLEDNVPQRIESFQLIQPRGRVPVNELREPNTVAESREMARDPASRVFVLFMDLWHVQLEGSYHAQGPVTRLLNRVIGRDDLVGVMTPEMSARNLTLARRTETIEGDSQEQLVLGRAQSDQLARSARRGVQGAAIPIRGGRDRGHCARSSSTAAASARRLSAIEDLIVHLEGIREERKFVVMLTEGWLLPRAGSAAGSATGRTTATSTVARPAARSRLAPIPAAASRWIRDGTDATARSSRASASGRCSRSPTTSRRFRDLLQRANRANVSFYPLDARGLVVFDEPIGPDQAATAVG